MAKINKQMYYTANGERKLNCYKINIPKQLVKQAEISDKDELEIKAKKGSIIIQKRG